MSGIEGLRAIAALGVLGSHFIVSVEAQAGLDSVHPLIDGALRAGTHGVNLFFVLSGFLLALPFLEAMVAGAPLPSIRRYFLARALRIVPAFWLILTVLIFATHSSFKSLQSAAIDYAFLQVFADVGHAPIVAVGWTLGIEIQFYLLLPLLALATRALLTRLRATHRERVFGITIAFLLLFLIIPFASDASARVENFFGTLDVPDNVVTHAFVAPYLSWFSLGMGLAFIYVLLRRSGNVRVLPALPMFGLAVVLVAINQARWLGPYDYWPARLWPAVLLAGVAFGRGPGSQFFGNGLLHGLGVISYGIYLWHEPIIEKIGASKLWLGPSQAWLPVNFLAVVLVTVGCAALSYYAIERWALLLKDERGRAQFRREREGIVRRLRRRPNAAAPLSDR